MCFDSRVARDGKLGRSPHEPVEEILLRGVEFVSLLLLLRLRRLLLLLVLSHRQQLIQQILRAGLEVRHHLGRVLDFLFRIVGIHDLREQVVEEFVGPLLEVLGGFRRVRGQLFLLLLGRSDHLVEQIVQEFMRAVGEVLNGIGRELAGDPGQAVVGFEQRPDACQKLRHAGVYGSRRGHLFFGRQDLGYQGLGLRRRFGTQFADIRLHFVHQAGQQIGKSSRESAVRIGNSRGWLLRYLHARRRERMRMTLVLLDAFG